MVTGQAAPEGAPRAPSFNVARHGTLGFAKVGVYFAPAFSTPRSYECSPTLNRGGGMGAHAVLGVGVYFARTGIGLLAPKPLLKNPGTGSRATPLRLLAAMSKQLTPAELYRTHQLKAPGGTPAPGSPHAFQMGNSLAPPLAVAD